MNHTAVSGTAAPSGAAPAARVPLDPGSARVHREAVGFDAATLRRGTAMAFRHRTRMALALLATALAAGAQIAIPRLIGDALDHATGLLASGTAGEATARAALAHGAWLLLGTAAFRGACTMPCPMASSWRIR